MKIQGNHALSFRTATGVNTAGSAEMHNDDVNTVRSAMNNAENNIQNSPSKKESESVAERKLKRSHCKANTNSSSQQGADVNDLGSVDDFDKKDKTDKRIKTDDAYCQTDEPCINYMNCTVM